MLRKNNDNNNSNNNTTNNNNDNNDNNNNNNNNNNNDNKDSQQQRHRHRSGGKGKGRFGDKKDKEIDTADAATRRKLLEAMLPSFFLGAPNASCTDACSPKNEACDAVALKLIVRNEDCQWILQKMNITVIQGGNVSGSNAGCTYDSSGGSQYKVMGQTSTEEPQCDASTNSESQRVCRCLKAPDGDKLPPLEYANRRRAHRRRRNMWKPEDDDTARARDWKELRQAVEVLSENVQKVKNETNGRLRNSILDLAAVISTERQQQTVQSNETKRLMQRVEALGMRDEEATQQAIQVLKGELRNLSQWMVSVEHGLLR